MTAELCSVCNGYDHMHYEL